MREGLFSSQAPIACRRETLIRRSNSSSTSGVGLNFPLHLVPYNPHGPLEIFRNCYMGLKPISNFSNPPPDLEGPLCPLFQLLFRYTSVSVKTY